MEYSDKDLMVSTQIAYYDVSNNQVGSEKTIGYIIKNDRDNNTGTYLQVVKQMNEAEKEHGIDSLQYKRFKETLAMYDSIADGTGEYSKYSTWKVVDVKDDNVNSGFYGCVIETDSDHAIVAYRGSESTNKDIMPEKGNQTYKDWVKADFGLLNSVSTEQQEVGREYLLDVMSEGKYKSYIGVGHSLGDNLMTDSYLYLPEEYRDKMSVYGFDGPGFSKEYIAILKAYYEANGWDLEKATGNITHYQWSLVGTIFFGNLPGINFKTVKTTDDVYGNNGFTALIQKHAVVNLKFDEDGNLIVGEMDWLAHFICEFTNAVDDLVDLTLAYETVFAYMCGSEAEKKALLKSLVSDFFTESGIVSEVGLGYAAVILSVLGIDYIDKYLGKDILESFEQFKKNAQIAIDKLKENINKAVKKTFAFLNVAKNTISKILSAVKSVLNRLNEYIFKSSTGYKYASANPCIVINTTKMNSYAEQLAKLSQRAKSLDRRMNSLYWQLGIDWSTISNLGKLLKAEVVLDFAYRLDKNTDFLRATASEFERVEREISNMAG